MQLKVIVSSLVVVACVAGSALASDTVSSVNVVGYYQIPITSNALNLISIPMSKLPAYRGVISASDSTTITDSNANWAADQFLWGGTNEETMNPSIKSHFYIVISDTNYPAFDGRYMDITNNTANNTLTIIGGVDADIVAAPPPGIVGASYKIIAHNRAIDIFANQGLKAGNNVGGSPNADYLIFWGGPAWQSRTFLYWTNSGSGLLKGHFVQDGLNVDDKVVRPDVGMFLGNISSNYTITVAGEVSANAQKIVLDQGLNLIGGLSVVDQQIVNAELKNVMKPGNNVGGTPNADYLIFWGTNNAWQSRTFLYWTNSGSGLLKGHFVQDGVNVDSSKVVRAASGYFMYVITNTPPVWNRTSPLQ